MKQKLIIGAETAAPLRAARYVAPLHGGARKRHGIGRWRNDGGRNAAMKIIYRETCAACRALASGRHRASAGSEKQKKWRSKTHAGGENVGGMARGASENSSAQNGVIVRNTSRNVSMAALNIENGVEAKAAKARPRKLSAVNETRAYEKAS
jgi:hypothetical protein